MVFHNGTIFDHDTVFIIFDNGRLLDEYIMLLRLHTYILRLKVRAEKEPLSARSVPTVINPFQSSKFSETCRGGVA
jgi:hypothetical protein